MRPVDDQSERVIESARVVREPFRQGQGKLCLAKVFNASPNEAHSGILRLYLELAISAILTITRCRISLRMLVIAMFLCLYSDPAN